MKTRIAVMACMFAFALAPPANAAPPPISKVGFLGASTAEQANHLLKAFKQGLCERGYEEERS